MKPAHLLALATILLGCAIFAIDLMAPAYVASGLLYVSVVVLSSNLRWRYAAMVSAGVCSVLICLSDVIVGVQAAAPGPVAPLAVNGVLELCAVWVTAALAFDRRRLARELVQYVAHGSAKLKKAKHDLSSKTGSLETGSLETGSLETGHRDDVGATALPPTVDWSHAMGVVDQDRELLAELAQTLLEETPKQLTEIHDALSAGDHKVIQRAAHTIKGSLRCFGATVSMETAYELELAAKEESLQDVPRLLKTLAEQVKAVSESLAKFVSDGTMV